MVGEKLFQTNLLSRLSHKVCRLLSSPVLLRKFTKTVICMDPHSPNKLLPTKYCFLILGDEFLFLNYFFIFRFFFFRYFMLFCYYCIAFVFSCSGMFRHVPECSGMFHVPDFIDALKELFSASSVHLLLFIAKKGRKITKVETRIQ